MYSKNIIRFIANDQSEFNKLNVIPLNFMHVNVIQMFCDEIWFVIFWKIWCIFTKLI